MSRALRLALFLALTLGGGLALGFLTAPGEWYAGLNKPWFNPPGWLFGPVWTVLYILIAIAGWRAFEADPRGTPMRLWWAQLILNFAWTPAFFVSHQIGLALAIILLLLAIITGFIIASWRNDRAASLLFVPYLAWVAFASVLNGSIWWLN